MSRLRDAVATGSAITSGALFATGIPLVLSGRGTETNFLATLLRDGNSSVWSAASQIGLKASEGAGQIASKLMDYFTTHCDYYIAKVPVSVHTALCDSLRDTINSAPNDTLILGMGLGVLGALFGLAAAVAKKDKK